MNHFCTSIALAAALSVSFPGVQAQTYPSKPVRVIVPFAPGGGIDVLLRALSVRLSARWGQAVLVENKAGAGTLVGTQQVAQAPADGYTLLATVNQTFVGNRFLYKKLPYDPDKGFEPITMMVRADQLIVAHVGFPAATLKDAIEIARKKSGSVTYGSFGNGSQPHLLFSLIKDREKVELTHVPYNGITPNLTAVASGEVQLGTGSAAVVAPFIASGKVKPIAIAAAEHMSQYPNVTTTAEQGYPYAKGAIWYGLFAPAGTPAAVISKIRNDVAAVLVESDFAQQQILSKGLVAVAGDAKQLKDAILREADDVAGMIKAAGIVAE